VTTTAFERFEVLDSVLYEDGFCRLMDNQLTIYRAVERFGLSRTFNVQDIEWVATGHDLQLGRWAYKGWGMGLSPILWAMDIRRSPTLSMHIVSRKAVVLKPRGAWLRTGFTCDDPHELFFALENLAAGITRCHRVS